MNRNSSSLAALGLAAACAMPAALLAHEETDHQVMEGVEIYFGVIPAETLRRKHARGDPEYAMHRGIPRGAEYYHLNVSLFDAGSKVPIDDARVAARVEEIGGIGAQTRSLDRMSINDTVSFGNYFKMAGKGPFWITVTVRRPEPHRPFEVRLQHKHY